MSHSFRRRPLFSTPQPIKPPARKWRWLHVARGAVRRTCTALGAMLLLSMMFSCVLVTSVAPKGQGTRALPERMVLFMPLEKSYPEHNTFSYRKSGPTLREVTAALDAAREDKRVKGVVATLRGASYDMAQLYELRAAVKRFRESGKFAYFYTGSFAEQGQGLGSYYLASAFGEVWMQPMGALSIPGVKVEMPFALNLLTKLGVTPDVFARKEYKNVFESFAASSMSEPTREVMTALVGDIALQLRGDIATDREVTPEALQDLIDRGLLLDNEALQAGLVDKLDYADTLTETIQKEVTGDADSDEAIFVDIGHYAQEKARNHAAKSSKKPKVALVYAVGTIVPHVATAGAPGVFMGGPQISATEMGMTLNDAIDDDDIKVIVLRLNSPGGSPSASETLRWKIVRAQQKGKKVIVSMGEAAASGGYWIAAPADYIFATPLTLTGSIGVAGGKFVIADLWAKLGVNWDDISWGENAGMWSINEVYTEQGRARYGAMMDSVYDGFVSRVAQGRKMDVTKAEGLAHGRVWTGLQAQKRGLVDEIGGLDAALDYAAVQAGAKDRSGVTLEVLPKPETALERLTRLLETQAGLGQWFSSLLGEAHMAASGGDVLVYDRLTVR